MLTIEKIKELIGDSDISNDEAEGIRDECRILAEIIFERWLDEKRKNQIRSPRSNQNNFEDSVLTGTEG